MTSVSSSVRTTTSLGLCQGWLPLCCDGSQGPCTAPALAITDASAAYARSRGDWVYREFAGCHNAMTSHPQEIAELLIEEAARPAAE